MVSFPLPQPAQVNSTPLVQDVIRSQFDPSLFKGTHTVRDGDILLSQPSREGRYIQPTSSFNWHHRVPLDDAAVDGHHVQQLAVRTCRTNGPDPRDVLDHLHERSVLLTAENARLLSPLQQSGIRHS